MAEISTQDVIENFDKKASEYKQYESSYRRIMEVREAVVSILPIDYYMIDLRTNEYICYDSGRRVVVSEKLKYQYEKMYAQFDKSPLDCIRFVDVKEAND